MLKIKKFMISFALLFFVPYILLIYGFIPTAGIDLLLAKTLYSLILPLNNIYLHSDKLLSDSISFSIVPDCSGFVMIFMFFALIFSSKGTFKNKFLSLLIFSPLLFVFNIFRLFLTLLVAFNFGKLAFDVVHISLWFFDSAVVISAWLLSLEFIFKKKLVGVIQSH